MSFFTRITARARAIDSVLCVGLDPRPADAGQPHTAAAAAAACHALVAQTRNVTVCYKPNAAFFEQLGPDGMRALRDVIAAIPDDIPVLLDAKRGDIASSASAYAAAAFDVWGADAVTVNAYLGADSLAPFLDHTDKAVFALCKTSNPSASELQDLSVRRFDGAVLPMYLAVADVAVTRHPDRVGLVVGATQRQALSAVRHRHPDAWLLTPGVGAQGADAAATYALARRQRDGLGVIVPVSRGISRAPDPAAAAAALRDALRPSSAADAPPRTRATPSKPLLARIADGLIAAGCVRFGAFTLKSGKASPIYLDLRRLIAAPDLLAEVARAYVHLMSDLPFDHVAALPYAALPIGTAVSLASGWSLVYPRREAKSYGTRAAVEGVFSATETAVVLDDLATTGGSKVEAIAALQAVGLRCQDIVVLIDREAGARRDLEDAGYGFHAVFTLSDLVARWHAAGHIDGTQAAAVLSFIAAQ